MFQNRKKPVLNKICIGNYDRYWLEEINHSPKAISYAIFMTTIYLEKYLILVKNTKHRIALSRLRLSNHNLMIEKGRHVRPRMERNERKCFLCKDEIEDEKHFITKCPLYAQERTLLFQNCCQNSLHLDSLTTVEQQINFILMKESKGVTTKLTKFVYDSFKGCGYYQDLDVFILRSC